MTASTSQRSKTIRLLARATASLVALAIIGAITVIGVRNYRAVMLDFTPWPGAAILRHPDQTGVPNLESVSFKTATGLRIAGWYVPARNRAAVIVTHGTNTDRSARLPEIQLLANAGFGVLAFDWPGNGESEGRVQWGEGERQALRAAIDWLAQRNEVDIHKIGGLGFSMGSYMMAQVAATDTRLHAVVLAATPTSFLEYTRLDHRQWGLLSELPAQLALRASGMKADEFTPLSMVKSIAPRALLIIGGAIDSVVPATMSQQLYQAAQQPKSLWIVPGAAHGNYLNVAPREYRQRLVEFFSRELSAEPLQSR
jgi:dipeptidyl aminopeptidase/acylaminoacyl peptidase